MQDRCTVCAEGTMGMEIILDVPDRTLGDVGQGEARFSPFGDSISLDANRCTVGAEHAIGSEVIFGRTQWNS